MCRAAIESWWFEGLTFVFVVVNMGMLAAYRYDHSKVSLHCQSTPRTGSLHHTHDKFNHTPACVLHTLLTMVMLDACSFSTTDWRMAQRVSQRCSCWRSSAAWHTKVILWHVAVYPAGVESRMSACWSCSTAATALLQQPHCTHLRICLAAGPRSYLSSPVEVIDFVVVVLSVANAASGKLLNLNMIRMVRCKHSGGIVLRLHCAAQHDINLCMNIMLCYLAVPCGLA